MTILPRPIPTPIYTKKCILCGEKFESTSQLSITIKYNKHIIKCRKKELKEFNEEYYLE